MEISVGELDYQTHSSIYSIEIMNFLCSVIISCKHPNVVNILD